MRKYRTDVNASNMFGHLRFKTDVKDTMDVRDSVDVQKAVSTYDVLSLYEYHVTIVESSLDVYSISAYLSWRLMTILGLLMVFCAPNVFDRAIEVALVVDIVRIHHSPIVVRL